MCYVVVFVVIVSSGAGCDSKQPFFGDIICVFLVASLELMGKLPASPLLLTNHGMLSHQHR